jgi:F-type H+-transporting ATPase subunit b
MSAVFGDPTFWVAVAFVIFIAILARPIAKAVPKALDERALKIKRDLDEAERLRIEAQDLLAEYQRKQRDAVREAGEIVAHARAEAARLTEDGRKRLEQSLKRREQLAVERIARAETAALAEVRAKAIDVAIEATRRLLAERAAGAKADTLIDAAIKDLPGKLH